MPKPKALNHLSDINVAELTLCKNPAVPAAANIVLKSEDATAGRQLFSRSFAIKSTDPARKQIFLYFLAPDTPDLQGDVVSAVEVEKACHAYMKNLSTGNVKGEGTGYEHQIFKQVGYPIQCAIDYTGAVGKAAGCAEPVVGGWWVGIQCTDETWEKVEKGEIGGGSIGGVATRTPIEDATVDPSLGKKLNGIIKGMADKLRKQESGPVTFDEAVAENENRQRLWDLTNALDTSIRSIMSDDSLEKDAKIVKMGASIDQFKTAMLQFMAIQKAVQDTVSANGAVVDKSAAVLKAAREAITTELNKLIGDTPGEPDNGGNDMDPKELSKTIEDAITKAVTPLTEQVTALKADVRAMKEAAEKAKVDASDAQVTELFDNIDKGLADFKQRLEKLENKPAARQGESPDGEIKKTDEPTGAVAGKVFFGGGN